MRSVKRIARWLAVSTVGSVLVVVGIALLFLPGPGILVIIAGLAILSIEFLWAQRLRERTLRRLRDARRRAGRRVRDDGAARPFRDSDAA